MLPYAYTTNDVAQLFAPFGKLARVLVLRDKQTRRSRGVAFVQFARAEDCAQAVGKMDKMPLEGMTLAVSLSHDNGRSREFAQKRKYTTSQRCFECGELGHVSYECPRNVLGARERPVTTGGKSSRKNLKKKKKKFDPHELAHYFNEEGVVNMLYVACTACLCEVSYLMDYWADVCLQSAAYGLRRRRSVHLAAGVPVGSVFSFVSTASGEYAPVIRSVRSYISTSPTAAENRQLLQRRGRQRRRVTWWQSRTPSVGVGNNLST